MYTLRTSPFFDIQPEDEITDTDSTTIKTTKLGSLSFTNVDTDSDTLQGIAEPNKTFGVNTCWQSDPRISWETTSDAAGAWQADLTAATGEPVDLRAGVAGSGALVLFKKSIAHRGWTPLLHFVQLSRRSAPAAG